MRIAAIEIHNFKALGKVALKNLSDVILIAGPNGSGKSCIFDAIRLLKSVYGGYSEQDEVNNFFNEFQLRPDSPEEIRRIFTDKSKEVKIRAQFSLARRRNFL